VTPPAYKNYKNIKNFIGDWGLGIGDWGLGIGDWAQSPIPNPQSPIPNPQLINIFQYKDNIFINFKNEKLLLYFDNFLLWIV